MKKISKIFALLLAVIMLCSLVACNKNNEEVALTAEEVQKVEEVSEVLNLVADIEIPDLENLFAKKNSIFALDKTGYEGLNSEKYQSMRLDFEMSQSMSMSFSIPESLRNQIEDDYVLSMILSMFQDMLFSFEYKGYVLLTETSCQFTYTKTNMTMKMAGSNIEIDMPFALYMDNEEVYLRYDKFGFVETVSISGEEPTVFDIGQIAEAFLGNLLGKWIDLDKNYVSEDLADYFTQAFAECGNALTAELNTYADYIEENLSKKFVKKGDKYVLGSQYFKELVEEISANVSEEYTEMEDVNYTYNKFTGEFEFDVSNMEEPKIRFNYDMDAEDNFSMIGVLPSGENIGIKVLASGDCTYTFSGFNSTTLSRPTEVYGWPD